MNPHRLSKKLKKLLKSDCKEIKHYYKQLGDCISVPLVHSDEKNQLSVRKVIQNIKVILSSQYPDLINHCFEQNPVIFDHFIGLQTPLSDKGIHQLSVPESIINIKAILASHCLSLSKYCLKQKPEIFDACMAFPLLTDKRTQPFFLSEVMNNINAILASRCSEVSTHCLKQNPELFDYYIGLPLTLNDGKQYQLAAPVVLKNIKKLLSSRCTEVQNLILEKKEVIFACIKEKLNEKELQSIIEKIINSRTDQWNEFKVKILQFIYEKYNEWNKLDLFQSVIKKLLKSYQQQNLSRYKKNQKLILLEVYNFNTFTLDKRNEHEHDVYPACYFFDVTKYRPENLNAQPLKTLGLIEPFKETSPHKNVSTTFFFDQQEQALDQKEYKAKMTNKLSISKDNFFNTNNYFFKRPLKDELSRIGPRKVLGWWLKDVPDDGNCFYWAVIHQLQTIYPHHPFLSAVPEGVNPIDCLRAHVQGDRFKDGQWTEDKEFKVLARTLNVMLAVARTTHPEAGFVCYYFDAEKQEDVCNVDDEERLPTGYPCVKIAATGDHFLSVTGHPQLSNGAVKEFFYHDSNFDDFLFESLEAEFSFNEPDNGLLSVENKEDDSFFSPKRSQYTMYSSDNNNNDNNNNDDEGELHEQPSLDGRKLRKNRVNSLEYNGYNSEQSTNYWC